MTPIPWRSSPGAWPARCGDLARYPRTSTRTSNAPTRCTWPTSPEGSRPWRSADRRLVLARKKGGERIRAGVTLSQRRRLIVAMWARMWAGFTALLVVVVVASLLTGVLTPVQASSPQLLTESPQAQVAQKPKVVLKLLAITDDAQINAWKEILEEFHKFDGGKWSYVEIAFETVPFQDLFPKIESAVAAGSDMAMVQSDGPDMKRDAFYRSLIPLDKFFTDAEKKQWLPQSLEEGSYRG